MKKKRVERKLKLRSKLMELRKGKNYVVVYFQEGKRLSYYSGNYLKKKKNWGLYYRKMDRSSQKFIWSSPHFLFEL